MEQNLIEIQFDNIPNENLTFYYSKSPKFSNCNIIKLLFFILKKNFTLTKKNKLIKYIINFLNDNSDKIIIANKKTIIEYSKLLQGEEFLKILINYSEKQDFFSQNFINSILDFFKINILFYSKKNGFNYLNYNNNYKTYIILIEHTQINIQYSQIFYSKKNSEKICNYFKTNKNHKFFNYINQDEYILFILNYIYLQDNDCKSSENNKPFYILEKIQKLIQRNLTKKEFYYFNKYSLKFLNFECINVNINNVLEH
jgi:hypothetical protein